MSEEKRGQRSVQDTGPRRLHLALDEDRPPFATLNMVSATRDVLALQEILRVLENSGVNNASSSSARRDVDAPVGHFADFEEGRSASSQSTQVIIQVNLRKPRTSGLSTCSRQYPGRVPRNLFAKLWAGW